MNRVMLLKAAILAELIGSARDVLDEAEIPRAGRIFTLDGVTFYKTTLPLMVRKPETNRGPQRSRNARRAW